MTVEDEVVFHRFVESLHNEAKLERQRLLDEDERKYDSEYENGYRDGQSLELLHLINRIDRFYARRVRMNEKVQAEIQATVGRALKK